MSDTFFPDLPVDGSPDRKDMLHRMEYAVRLAKNLSIVSGEGSVVAALEGKWGSGKTSIFEMICRHYRENNAKSSPVIVRFNPWMFSGLDNLVQQFLLQFGTAVGVGQSGGVKLKRVGEELVKYSAVFDVLKLVPGADPWASLVKKVMSSSGVAAKEIGALKELNLERQRDRVVDAIIKSNKSFLVIVDDVDRLAPSEVHAMLQLVKVVSNFPRVNYLLAYDQETIEAALETARIPNPSGYLEKIVQLRLPMPRMSAQDGIALLNYFLKDFGNDEDEFVGEGEREAWSVFAHRYIIPLLRTPRDFVRLVNRLRMNYSLVKGEISFKEYCALEVIAVVAPGIYDHVKANPMCYIGSDPQDVLSYDDKKKEKASLQRAEKLKSIDDAIFRERITRTLNKLFPYASVGRDFLGGNASRRSGRLCNAENFEFAFYFSRPATLVSLNDLRRIWRMPSERWSLLSAYASEETGKAMLDLIGEVIGERQVVDVDWGLPEDVEGFLFDYAKFVDLPDIPEGFYGLMELSYSERFASVSRLILGRVEELSRTLIAERFCASVETLPLSSFVILNQFWSRNKKSRGDEDHGLLYDDEQFRGIEKVWKETMISALGADAVWLSRHLRWIFQASLVSDLGEQIVSSILLKGRGSQEFYRGLEALLHEGTTNGRRYLQGPDEFVSQRLDVKRLRSATQGLAPRDSRAKAVVNCFNFPGKRFFLNTGEEYL